MSAPAQPEVLLRDPTPQGALPLVTEGVMRYVWNGRFSAMLIEVRDGVAYVNGHRVEPISHASATPDKS